MKIDIGNIVEGECVACSETAELRYEGMLRNPVRRTNKPAYTCMSCGTTRVYGKLIGGISDGN